MGTEVFNASQVKSVISDVEAQFADLASVIEKSNTAITTALGSPDKAVYGDAGNKILATWDENCSTLNEFIKIFDNWSLMVTSIAKEYGELDSGTAKVDNVDLSSFKAISGANKTTYLSTDSAKSKYEGSKSEYYDFNENAKYVETNDLNKRRVVTKTSQGNNSTIDYEDMAGNKLNVSSVDSSGRAITKEEAAQLEKVKEAQKALQSSIKTKHDELKKRDKERKELSEYLNPGKLSGDNLDFLKSIVKGAVAAYKKHGVLPSLTLAQAILESYWGRSNLSAKYNNLFGIKAGSNWNGKTVNLRTGEQNPNGSRYTINADFRVYDNVADSIEDHALLLCGSRYKNVIASKNYKDACYAVKAAGYATSINYANNLIRIIEQFGLNQWDPKV